MSRRLSIDTGSVRHLAATLDAPVGELIESAGHLLHGLTLDPSVLMRANIRQRIIHANRKAIEAGIRIKRLQRMTRDAADWYDAVDHRLARQRAGGHGHKPVNWVETLAGLIAMGPIAFIGAVMAGNPNVRESFLHAITGDTARAIKAVLDRVPDAAKVTEGLINRYVRLWADDLALMAVRMGRPDESVLKAMSSGLDDMAGLGKSVGTFAKTAGWVVGVAGAVWDGVSEWHDSLDEGASDVRAASNGVVVGGASMAGFAVGTAIGTALFPGPGTVVGAVVGAGIGMASSWATQQLVDNKDLGGGRSIKDRIGDVAEGVAAVCAGDTGKASGLFESANQGLDRSPIAVGLRLSNPLLAPLEVGRAIAAW